MNQVDMVVFLSWVIINIKQFKFTMISRIQHCFGKRIIICMRDINRKGLLLMLLPILFSCSTIVNKGELSDEMIRRLAIEYESYSPLSSLLESFVFDYYRTPNDKNEFFRYVNIYDKADSKDLFTLFKEQMGGNSPRKYLRNNSVNLSSYADSCFIYDSKHKFGSVVYGTPSFWANADPWKPCVSGNAAAFLDNKQRPIYNDADTLRKLLQSGMNEIWNKYDKIIVTEAFVDSLPRQFIKYASNIVRSKRSISYRVAFHYSIKTGLELNNNQYHYGCLKEYSRKTGKELVLSTNSVDLSMMSDYEHELNQFLDLFIKDHPKVHDIFFLTPVYYNHSLSTCYQCQSILPNYDEDAI